VRRSPPAPAAVKPEAPHRYLLNGDIFLVELIDKLVDAAGDLVSDLADAFERLRLLHANDDLCASAESL
jgi:hypothetical protein